MASPSALNVSARPGRGKISRGRVEHQVSVRWDGEAGVWFAVCDSIPLAMECGSFDALIERVKDAAPEVLAENGKVGPFRLRFKAVRQESIA